MILASGADNYQFPVLIRPRAPENIVDRRHNAPTDGADNAHLKNYAQLAVLLPLTQPPSITLKRNMHQSCPIMIIAGKKNHAGIMKPHESLARQTLRAKPLAEDHF